MMCSRLLKVEHNHGWLYRKSEAVFQWIIDSYGSALRVVLNHPALTMFVMLVTLVLNVYLYIKVPKGFFPQQDTGRMQGQIQGQQHISFAALSEKIQYFEEQVRSGPGSENGGRVCGSGRTRRQLRYVVSGTETA